MLKCFSSGVTKFSTYDNGLSPLLLVAHCATCEDKKLLNSMPLIVINVTYVMPFLVEDTL